MRRLTFLKNKLDTTYIVEMNIGILLETPTFCRPSFGHAPDLPN